MHFQHAATLAACFTLASAAVRGFNTGSTQVDGTVKTQDDFEAEFKNQQNLAGTDGVFTSARLYTMIQGGTPNTPISAIPAAISTKTGLLLGLWASAGGDLFQNELAALQSAIDQYGSDFADLVEGISIGSEDLYRITPKGIKSNAGPGATPETLTGYIGQVRDLIAGTSLANAPIGHVDTWTTWVNTTNKAVADACDWVGIDAYPYYESENGNPINEAGGLFYTAFDKTKSTTGKPVWVTESGWPVSGPEVGQAVASVENARSYWVQVYCTLGQDVPVYWYTQRDANGNNDASFGITGTNLQPQPLYNLQCPARVSSSTGPAAPSTTVVSSTFTTEGSSTTSNFTIMIPSTTTSDIAPETSDAATSTDPTGTAPQSTVTDDSQTSALTPPYPTTDSTTASAPTATPTDELSGADTDTNSASNIQIGALAFLAVPALLAFMA